jgi:hypothetical protein
MSACEVFIVDKGTSTLNTTMHLGSSTGEGTPTVVANNGHVDLGSTLHDLASVQLSDGFTATDDCALVERLGVRATQQEDQESPQPPAAPRTSGGRRRAGQCPK